jgi:hypothetical protein
LVPRAIPETITYPVPENPSAKAVASVRLLTEAFHPPTMAIAGRLKSYPSL